MAIYAKDKSFNAGWMIGGAAIMFGTNFVGGIMLGMMQMQGVLPLAVTGLICYAAGGFIIGWKSEGQTILEAGLAAFIATIISVFLMARHADLGATLLGGAITFAAGLFGGWIGEKVQGDDTGAMSE